MSFRKSIRNLPSYLHEHKLVNFVLVIIYFSIVVLPHQWFGDLIAALFDHFSRSFYQGFMLALAVLLVLVYLYFLAKLIIRQSDLLTYLALFSLLILTFLAYPFIIIHYIEAIHYLQYAVLAFLLFPLFQNYYKVAFWGVLLAFVDESYQYFYLDPDTKYLDFNDVVLDQIGLIWGLLLHALIAKFPLKKTLLTFRNYLSEIITGVAFVLLILFLLLFNQISLYPDPDIAINIIKDLPLGFWQEIEHLDVRYHIILPLEGMIIITFLYFYFCILLNKIHRTKKIQSS